MTDPAEARKCFSCCTVFNTDGEFWNHILNVDCGNSANVIKNDPISSPPCKQLNSDQSEDTSTDNFYFCGLCETKFSSKEDFQLHPSSSEHLLKLNLAAKERINGDFDPSTTNNKPHLFCDVCQVQLPSIEAREIHEAGKKHKKLCERQPGVRMHLNTNPASNEVPISINTTHSPENVLDNQVESPLVMDSSDNSHLVNNNKVNVTSQPTVRSFDKSDIVRLLRQVCLTQILSLMHEMTDDISPQINGESITTQSKISEHDLMEMIRSVCREELHAILRPTS